MADNYKDNIKALRDLNLLLEQQKTLALALGNMETARTSQIEITANNEKIINELKQNNNNLTKEEQNLLNEIENKQKEINNQLDKEIKNRQRIVNVLGAVAQQLKLGWSYLQSQDKVIKSTILGLGMSGTKAELMRSSFEQSAGFVARLGGNIEDIQHIMTGYADETGRARVLSADMVKNITLIGKGTGLGIEQATKLGAQFELMGFDAKSTMDYVQGVVDTSERMGVNTTKVLEVVNENFKRLNTYTFQQGVKGFAQMAMYAEKFKIDISQALNAADVAKSLEGAVDLAANLQIMGGEFAKTDPFEMLFLSRNDPAKFTEKIADMTKGVVSFRKMADGTFEKFISPADRDRLKAVAKSLGMEASELTQIAERQAEIQKMRQQMLGMGLSNSEKDLIEGAAIFNKSSGKFEVELSGKMRDISTLTKEQANSFAKQSVSLKTRAEQAQTFDEVFKATIMELKATLLPILKSVNGILTAIRPKEWSGGLATTATLLITAGVLWKTVTLGFSKAVDNWVKTGSMMGKTTTGEMGGVRRFLSPKTAGPTGGVPGGTTGGATGNVGRSGAGMGILRGGAGIGAAALGIGAGVGLAAVGISKLADAMSKLDKTQIAALPTVILSLGAAFIPFAVALTIVGTAGKVSAGGLLAVGAAAALIGAGIGFAAMGIGKMGEGLSKLKGAGKNMIEVGEGVGIMSLSLMGLSSGVIGLAVFAGLMRTISKNAPAMAIVGDAFKQINAVMSGSREDFLAIQNAVESIANINIKGGGALTELANLLKSPLKVEFADKKLAVVSDITLNIDGQKFMQKTYSSHIAIQKHEDLRLGKS